MRPLCRPSPSAQALKSWQVPQYLWSSEVWEWRLWWQTGACTPRCPAHPPQPQVIHTEKWKHLRAPAVWGPSQPLRRHFSGPGLTRHRSVLQISYRYLIIALGIQLDYEKVRFKLLLCSLTYLCQHQTWALVALYSFWQEKVLRYPPLVLFLRSLFMVLKKPSLRVCQ